MTPQTQQQRSLAGQTGKTTQATKNNLFTIDTVSQGMSQNLIMHSNQSAKPPATKHSKQNMSLSSQLVQSLRPKEASISQLASQI